MKNKYNLLFSIILAFAIVMFISNQVSAIEINPFGNQDKVQREISDGMDNFIKEDFNQKYGSIRISKSFLWVPTENLAEYSLTDNSDLCIIDCFATGKAVLYSEGKLFDSFDAKDDFGNLATITDLKIYLDVVESQEIQVPATYKTECTQPIINKNGSKSNPYCLKVPLTYKTEVINRTVQKEYNGEILPAGKYSWRITGKKNKTQDVDWAVGIRGISTDQIRKTWTHWTTADCTGTGGTVYIDGEYCVHRFESNGTFGLLKNIASADILTVGGGGSGGTNLAGGGGAGGLIYNSSVPISANQTVTVGIGGAVVVGGSSQGNKGTLSQFGTISGIAHGGGGGKDRNSGTNANGGSGGGGGYTPETTGGTGTAGQGNAGSDTTGASFFGTGGGGGAGTAGVPNGTGENAGRGGAGLNYSINGTNMFYAAGGGGASGAGGCQGAGGSGIGGRGSTDVGDPTCGTGSATATAGVNGTGSGGGGANPGNSGAGGTGIVIVRYLAGGFDGVTVNLKSPASGTVTTNPVVIFQANMTPTGASGGANITLFVWNVTGQVVRQVTNASLNPLTTTIQTNWTITLSDGNYTWNALGISNNSETDWGDANFTLVIDTTSPSSAFNSPTNNSYVYSTNASHIQIRLNFTGNDAGAGVSTCYWNASWNTTPNYVSCNPTYQTFVNLTNTFGLQKIYTYVNDSVNNLFSNSTQFIINRFYNYDNNSYETDSFNTSLEVWNQTVTPFVPALVYDSTNYSGTTTSLGGGKYSMNYTIDLPLTSSNVTKQFFYYWNDGQSLQSTGIYNQSLSKIIFGLCNSTNNVPYLNVTFKDENTLADLNASTDLFTGSYYLGSGTVNESILYTNTTANPKYAYCLTPSFKNLNLGLEYQYSATDYPQRTYSANYVLTNTTTNQTLYLLSTSDGIYVTFQTINNLGDTVSGISVRAEREFSGVPTTVAQGTTDASGAVTFWLNPNFPHTIYFSGSTCTSTQFTVTPTQSTYTVTLQCQGATNYDPSGLDGILFQKAPASGPLVTGVTTFNYSVSSVISNVSLTAAKFELIYANGTLIMQNASLVSLGEPYCTSTQCNLTLVYNVSSGDDLKARYYVDVGDGYILLEADAHWKAIRPSADRNNNLKLALSDLRTLFGEWTSPTCSATLTDNEQIEGYSCTLDELEYQNKIEYSRFVIIFLFMAICFAVLGKFTGYDGANPGAFIYLLGTVIIVGSLAGGRTGEGLFFYSNLTPFHFLNNYLLAFTMLMMMMGYWCMVSRRQT